MRSFPRVTAGVLVLLTAAAAWATAYYFSPNGNDSRDGLTPADAWKSLSKADGLRLVAGDSILLRGDSVHSSATGLKLSTDNVARFSADTPIVIASYPRVGGRASIRITANDRSGVDIYSVAGIAVRNLILEGPGPLLSARPGISIYTDRNGVRLRSVEIDRCDVSGFKQGISIGAWSGDTSRSGFDGVRITNCVTHDNCRTGIDSWGIDRPGPDGFGHRNIYVGHCVAHTNRGDPAYTANHSGNGIVLGCVTGAVIEYCEAYNNGELNASAHGNGPVGICLWETDRGVIQHCISHDNKSGNNADGGGFDLDGGCTNCVMQYNYSYDNVGAGYLICQYSGATAFRDDTVRYNISQNDARSANCHGAITWYSAGSNGGIRNVHVYHNTVYSSVSSAVRYCNTAGQSGNFVRNNLFVTSGGKPLVVGSVPTGTTLFQGNCYWSSGGAFSVAGYSSLADWRNATGQEMRGADICGIAADPKIVGPGIGTALGDPTQLPSLQAYRLQAGSPCIDAGLDLRTLSGISPGPRDFWGSAVPQGARTDIGACEYVPAVAAPRVAFSVRAPATAPRGAPPHLIDLLGRKNSVARGGASPTIGVNGIDCLPRHRERM